MTLLLGGDLGQPLRWALTAAGPYAVANARRAWPAAPDDGLQALLASAERLATSQGL